MMTILLLLLAGFCFLNSSVCFVALFKNNSFSISRQASIPVFSSLFLRQEVNGKRKNWLDGLGWLICGLFLIVMLYLKKGLGRSECLFYFRELNAFAVQGCWVAW